MQADPIAPIGDLHRRLTLPPSLVFKNPRESIEQERAKQEQLRELSARDLEVRTHEAAHLAAAGALAQGGPSFTLQSGPDGRLFAVGGSVRVDTSPGATPEETIQKARQLRAAALAPANPSPQDLAIAAAATAMELEARRELAKEKSEEGTSESELAGVANPSDNDSDSTSETVGEAENETDRADDDRPPNLFSKEFLEDFIEGKIEESDRPSALALNEEDDDEEKARGIGIQSEIDEIGFQFPSISEDQAIEEFLNSFISTTLPADKGLNVNSAA